MMPKDMKTRTWSEGHEDQDLESGRDEDDAEGHEHQDLESGRDDHEDLESDAEEIRAAEEESEDASQPEPEEPTDSNASALILGQSPPRKNKTKTRRAN